MLPALALLAVMLGGASCFSNAPVGELARFPSLRTFAARIAGARVARNGMSTGQGAAELRAGASLGGGRKFQFVDYGKEFTGSGPSICADGLVQGVTLQLTHWKNNNTPDKYKEDLSTEIALRWCKMVDQSDSEWAQATIVNNHFDTDGLMSVWALLNPELAQKYESRMVNAAAAGDFEEWGLGDTGVVLDLAFSKLPATARHAPRRTSPHRVSTGAPPRARARALTALPAEQTGRRRGRRRRGVRRAATAGGGAAHRGA